MGNIELIKDALEKTGITRDEAASLMRITRNTLYRWFDGKPSRNKIIEEFAVFQAKKLLAAFAAGTLPLVKNSADRMRAIQDALK